MSETQSEPLVEVKDLRVEFDVRAGIVKAVDGLNLTIHRGKLAAGRRQAHRGIERLRRQGGRFYMGIDVDEFTTRVERYVSGRLTRPALIELIFDPVG